MPDVLVPTNTPIRSAPYRARAAATAGDEVVLREAQRSEPIVAAIEVGDRGRQPLVVDTGNLADAGVEIHRFESAGREPAALVAQCGKIGGQSAPEAGRRGESG